MTGASGPIVATVICRRELIRFVREPARIAGAIGTPLLLWVFMASGFAESLRPESLGDLSYGAFLLPGMMTLVAVFASIFAGFGIIEDRNEGWLRGALVAPVPRWSIALGKTLGGAVVAWAQAAVLLVAALFLSVSLSLADVLLVLGGLALTSIAMTAMSVIFAWRSETSGSFHAVMNLLFLPLWLLSGAFFPVEGVAAWLGWVMRLNPLTWCTAAIRSPMVGEPNVAAMLAAALFALAMIIGATWTVSRPVKRLA
jgi:ABC-2 type transport system permease protein